MKSVYYTIWTDAIHAFRKKNPQREDWKCYLFFLITFCNALNLFVIFLWLKFLKIINWNLTIDISPSTFINNAISFCFYFSFPFVLMNYLLVFRHNRYSKLIDKYPNRNGKFAMSYGILSVLLSYLSVMAYWFSEY